MSVTLRWARGTCAPVPQLQHSRRHNSTPVGITAPHPRYTAVEALRVHGLAQHSRRHNSAAPTIHRRGSAPSPRFGPDRRCPPGRALCPAPAIARPFNGLLMAGVGLTWRSAQHVGGRRTRAYASNVVPSPHVLPSRVQHGPASDRLKALRARCLHGI